jgi:hypothetical protein
LLDTQPPLVRHFDLIAQAPGGVARLRELILTLAVQGNGPKVISAFADFYDSLDPAQQKQVREKLERRGHGWWSRG